MTETVSKLGFLLESLCYLTLQPIFDMFVVSRLQIGLQVFLQCLQPCKLGLCVFQPAQFSLPFVVEVSDQVGP